MKSQTYTRDSEILWAVTEGHYHLTAWLLHHETEVDARDEDGGGRTLLHWAVQENRVGIVHLLLSRGADPDAVEESFLTASSAAASDGNLRLLKILCHGGANPNGVGGNALPLISAVAWNRPQCVRYLLRRGADVNAAEKDGTTALVSAVHHGHHALASYLLSQGARIDVRDEDGGLMWEINDEERIPVTTRDLSLEGGLTLWEMARENGDAKMLDILNSSRAEFVA